MLLALRTSAQIIDTACFGEQLVRYGVVNNIGSTYSWILDEGKLVSGNGTNEIRVDWSVSSGIQFISVVEKNSIGCLSDTFKTQVLVIKKPVLAISGNTNICSGDSTTIIANGAFSFLWASGENSTSIKINKPIGTYPNYVYTLDPCPSDTVFFIINVFAKPSIPTYTYQPLLPVVGSDVSFTFNGNTNAKQSLLWQFEKGLPLSSKTSKPVVYFIDSGYKNIRLELSDSNGCKSYSISKIYIGSDEKVYPPQAFSPNGDGVNDVFNISGHGIKSSHIVIYNSWGNIMYESNDAVSFGWDGKLDNEPVMDGVYFYDISAVGDSNTAYKYSGTVTIVR